ncbi:MAG: hypothetical protein WCX16_01395 [Candidatus Omnitrophota bacterium]
MKKTIVVFAGIAVVILATALNCFALTEQKTFTLSATVPAVTSISIDAYNVNTVSGVATLESGTSLGFDPLTLDPVNNIYTADHYFYVNVQAVGGTPTTTLTFTQGANPNSTVGGNGLGWKGALTYTKVVGTTVTDLTAHPKELFANVAGDVVAPSEITGGFFRAYLGLNTGTAMPAGGEIFNPADKPGLYDGTLLVSATIP